MCLCCSLTNHLYIWFFSIVVHWKECTAYSNSTYGELMTALWFRLKDLLPRIPCWTFFFFYWDRMWQLHHHFAAGAGKAAPCPHSTGAAAAEHHKHSWVCFRAETPGGKDLWSSGEAQFMLLTGKWLHAERFSMSRRLLLETTAPQ